MKSFVDYLVDVLVVGGMLALVLGAAQCVGDTAVAKEMWFAPHNGELVDGVDVYRDDRCTYVVSKVMGGHAASASCF